MKKWEKRLLVFLVMSLTVSLLNTSCWAQAVTNPTDQGLAMMDLFVARPMSVVAGVIGAGLFVLSLPVTLSTNSTDVAGDMFIYQPFRFAFDRDFPDRSVIIEPDAH